MSNMVSFKTHITEAKEGKNVHLEHLEDQVLNRGAAGVQEALNFLHSLKEMLSGHVEKPINITTKWDGAPAVFCGINPDNGKFFVGTKGVFNKEAKLNYTEKDIDANHPSEGLNAKLKTCLFYLSKLGITGILQGELMFTKGDVVTKTIEGQKYITFTPNTITYAIPLSQTQLVERIHKAQLGIVFHTSYHGSSMSNLKANYTVDIGRLKHTKDVWFRDASLVDQSGTVSFTVEESQHLLGVLEKAAGFFHNINNKILNQIALNATFREPIKIFNNSKVREGEAITNTTEHTNELIRWLDKKMTKDIGDAKQPETKRKRTQEKTEVLGFLRSHSADLRDIFNLQNQLVYAKMIVVNKLQTVQGTHKFYKTADGYAVAGDEGFVAVDHIGNAVKLVDRLSFSHQNFTATKNWTK